MIDTVWELGRFDMRHQKILGTLEDTMDWSKGHLFVREER
jgi:hypothetical protein